MPVYSTQEYTDMVLILGECRGNQRAAATVYQERFPDRRHPNSSTIWRVVRTLRQNGRFRAAGRPAPDQTERRAERATAVLAFLYANPHASTRHIANELNVSQRTVCRILRQHRWHPYHLHLHQALSVGDHGRRVDFCLSIQACLGLDRTFLDHVLFSDESTFHRDGTVNTHNVHYWAERNPFWLRTDTHQIRWHVNVWCGILGNRLIGPYFLDGNLTGQRYLEFLRDTVIPEHLDELPLATLRDVWFQQDGAAPHNAHIVRDFLHAQFHQQWMGTYGPIRWPARSPDFTPLDFFLWGFLKSHVYNTAPVNAEDLRERIRTAAALVTPHMLQGVRANLHDRLDQCIAVHGQHFEHRH